MSTTTTTASQPSVSMSYDELVSMRNYIESMIKIHQVEILRILYKHGVYMNENQNGTHINIMELPQPVLEEINKYLEYVKYQETSLNVDEKQKEEYKNTFFSKTI
jgi:hypothetical protein